jgi:hypothetical protein
MRRSVLFIIFFIFFEKLVRLPTLQVHLMYVTIIKFGKTFTKLITRHPSTSWYGPHRLIDNATDVASTQKSQLR